MIIKPLIWDSQFFNVSIGKLEADTFTQSDIDKLKELKVNQGFDLIYLFLNQELDATILQPIFLADKKVVFKKKNVTVIINNNTIEEFSGNLTNDLLELVIESGHQSRFKNDSKLSPKFEDLYKIWIEKSIAGDLADKIFISKHESLITGFVTVKKKGNYSQIGLIAVSQNYRGLGIGKLLLEKVDFWNYENGIEYCEVATQFDNIEACALYKKLNYSIKSIQYIYHL
jgi:dTDP-4-amino-4,6-dideoxy-D-galactose acyltransferase